METFFCTLPVNYAGRPTYMSPTFTTTLNDFYFKWKLILRTHDIDLSFESSNVDVSSKNFENADFSLTMITKDGADAAHLKKNDNWLGHHFCGNFDKESLETAKTSAENNCFKLLLKISMPSANFEVKGFVKQTDQLIIPRKLADNLFDQIIGLTKADGLSDVVLISSDEKKYFCHKFVLYASSDVFKTMFTNFDCDKEINIEDIDAETLQLMLNFVYKEIDENKIDGPLSEKLLYAAEKYNLPELKKKCILRLKFHLDHTNVLRYLDLADKFRLETLGCACLQMLKLYEFRIDKADFDEFFKNHLSIVRQLLVLNWQKPEIDNILVF